MAWYYKEMAAPQLRAGQVEPRYLHSSLGDNPYQIGMEERRASPYLWLCIEKWVLLRGNNSVSISPEHLIVCMHVLPSVTFDFNTIIISSRHYRLVDRYNDWKSIELKNEEWVGDKSITRAFLDVGFPDKTTSNVAFSNFVNKPSNIEVQNMCVNSDTANSSIPEVLQLCYSKTNMKQVW